MWKKTCCVFVLSGLGVGISVPVGVVLASVLLPLARFQFVWTEGLINFLRSFRNKLQLSPMIQINSWNHCQEPRWEHHRDKERWQSPDYFWKQCIFLFLRQMETKKETTKRTTGKNFPRIYTEEITVVFIFWENVWEQGWEKHCGPWSEHCQQPTGFSLTGGRIMSLGNRTRTPQSSHCCNMEVCQLNNSTEGSQPQKLLCLCDFVLSCIQIPVVLLCKQFNPFTIKEATKFQSGWNLNRNSFPFSVFLCFDGSSLPNSGKQSVFVSTSLCEKWFMFSKMQQWKKYLRTTEHAAQNTGVVWLVFLLSEFSRCEARKNFPLVFCRMRNHKWIISKHGWRPQQDDKLKFVKC